MYTLTSEIYLQRNMTSWCQKFMNIKIPNQAAKSAKLRNQFLQSTPPPPMYSFDKHLWHHWAQAWLTRRLSISNLQVHCQTTDREKQNTYIASQFYFIWTILLIIQIFDHSHFFLSCIFHFTSYGTCHPGPSKNQRIDKSAPCQHDWDLVANTEWAPAQLTDHQQFINCTISPVINSSQGCRL